MTSVPFQPMDLSRLLDVTFKFYRDHFKMLFMTMLIIQTVDYFLTLLLFGDFVFRLGAGLQDVRPTDFAPLIGVALLSILTNIAALGVLTLMISNLLNKNETSIREAFTQLRPRFLALLGTSILAWLMIAIGSLLCIVPGIYFFFSYLLAAQVVMMENLSGKHALSRSKDLMRTRTEPGFTNSNVFKASVLLLVLAAVTYSVQAITAIPNLVYTFTKGLQEGAVGTIDPFSPVMILTQLISIVGYCFTKPLGMVGLIFLYYDIRSRKEGLDLELMAEKIASQAASSGNEAS